MKKFAKLLTLAMLSLALAAAPVVTVAYAAPDNEPQRHDGKKKKSTELHPSGQQTFAAGFAPPRHDLRPR